MERDESVFARNAQIVAVAGVAAGILGGLARQLMPAKTPQPTRQERVQMALADLTGRDVESIKAALGAEASKAAAKLGDLSDRAQRERGKARKQAKRKGKDARKRATEQARTLSASSASFGEHMRQAIREGASQAGTALQEALDETTSSLNQYAGDLGDVSAKASKQAKERREQAGKRAGEVRDVVGSRAEEGRKELMKLRKDTRGKAEDRLHEIEQVAREMVESRVKPAVGTVAATAAASATEAKKRAGEQAKHLGERYDELKPKVEKAAGDYSERAAELRDTAGERAAELRETAGARASELRESAGERAHVAEKAIREGSGQARQKAHDASESAKQGGKDFTSLMMWAGVAGGLVYLVFLNDEQKQKARELAKSAYHEGMGIYHDLRGENGDFQTTA